LKAQPDKTQIKKIADIIKNRLNNIVFEKTNNKVFAALWEFLLEIENTYQSACHNLIHEATIGYFPEGKKSWIDSNTPVAQARLLRTCLKMGTLDGNRKGCQDRKNFFTKFFLEFPNLQIGETIETYLLSYYKKINEELKESEMLKLNKYFGIF